MIRTHLLRLAALVVGISLGLAYSWVVAPVGPSGSSPAALRADFQDEYRSTIASAYSATGDLPRARARLALLGDMDPVQALTAHAQRALAAGLPFGHAQELAQLASDIQAGVSSIPTVPPPAPTGADTTSPSGTGSPSAVTPTTQVTPGLPSDSIAAPSIAPPSPTFSPRPSPPPTPGAPFKVVTRQNVCDPVKLSGLLQITVLDALGNPMPGVEVTITWNLGEERFFTGLQPEISAGYADYVMQADTRYAVQVARMGTPVSGLTIPSCPGSEGGTYPGGMELLFRAP